MQPVGQVGSQGTRWPGVHPQSLAQATRGAGLPKRQFMGGQLVEHDAHGEDVAARIAAHAHHLLGCHPGGRAHRLAQLLGQQIGVQGAARQAKVQQHHLSIRAHQHIGGLQIEMHHILLVQAVRSRGHGGAQAGHLGHRQQLRRLAPMRQDLAGEVFHDQIRQLVQVTRRDKTRHVGAGQQLQHLVLHLKADDVFSTVARCHARHLHRQGKAGVVLALAVAHAVDVRHAAGMNAGIDREAVQLGARFQQFHRAVSSRSAK